MPDTKLKIGEHEFDSRMIVGTGKYDDLHVMARALEASGTELVTVAVRRIDLSGKSGESILHYIDPDRYKLLPNTAGCYTADDAIRTAHLAREAGMSDMIKLEVIGDDLTLMPDPIETVKAAQELIKEGFVVLPYISDDPIVALKLQDLGVATLMPIGAPIGSGMGIQNLNNIRIILERAKVPVIVDAGVGTASDVAIAMELGCDGVLINTGIARARDPVNMAKAMRFACDAGRLAFLAGRIPKRLYAKASSPTEGLIGN
jgi:thiazole synthase